MEASSSFLRPWRRPLLIAALLLITAWREEYAWGMFALLLPPVGYGYALFRLDKAGASLSCALLGWILIWLGW